METFLESPSYTAVWTTAEFYGFWKAMNQEVSCSLISYPVKMSRQAGLAMRHNFPARPIIDYQLLKLREKGTLSRIQKSWLTNTDTTNHVCRAENNDWEASFQDVEVIFFVAILGISLAIRVRNTETLDSRRTEYSVLNFSAEKFSLSVEYRELIFFLRIAL